MLVVAASPCSSVHNHFSKGDHVAGRDLRKFLPWLETFGCCLAILVGSSVCDASEAGDGRAVIDVEYSRDIRPILSEHCFACHGPDPNARQADLRLDLRPAAVAAAIVPGNAEQSELVRRVTSDDMDEAMPPTDSNRERLTPGQIDLLRRWINQGAAFEEHWAYRTPQRPPVPNVTDARWPQGAIDRFVLARLEDEGLPPSPPADRRTLLRRLSFDLIGLPPSAEEVARFTADGSDHAYEDHVDRLLASPHFGERMAMYWLDVVRYADSVGIHGDQEISMSPYRDYVIQAFNRNMPFDQFITEQIAGDLLPDASRDQKVASAFNRLHMITSEGGAQPKEYLAKYAADRVRNTGSAILGSTLGCAQCHDHKFDPFTMRDFYRFAAFFADLKEKGVYAGNAWLPQMPVPTPEQAQEVERLEAAMARLRQQPEAPAEELAGLEKQLAALQKSIRTVLVSESVSPRVMRVLPRGNWLDESGEIVEPGVPESLAGIGGSGKEGGRATRRDLARWMTDRGNPLTARVFVNRIWTLAFGRGIVSTLDDFGTQGAWPSHPGLLDWLAVDFMENGWDVKRLFKQIVMSATYRQSSRIAEPLRVRDPENRLVGRQNRFRLDAEMIRDNALAISGLLVPTVGGRSVKPYQPAGYYAHLNFPKRTYQQDHGDNLYRRGVYTHWQRTFLHPSLQAFDAPTREECTVQRARSNTPLQSLVLLNDPTYVEAARVFAERILREGGRSMSDRLRFAYEEALGRPPRTEEQKMLEQLVAKHRQHFADHPEAARRLLAVGEKPSSDGIDPVELAAWTSVARTILSLHETITRG